MTWTSQFLLWTKCGHTYRMLLVSVHVTSRYRTLLLSCSGKMSITYRFWEVIDFLDTTFGSVKLLSSRTMSMFERHSLRFIAYVASRYQSINHQNQPSGRTCWLNSAIEVGDFNFFFVQRLYTTGVNNKFCQSPFGLKKTKFFMVYVSTT